MRHAVRLTSDAEADLRRIYDFISEKASPATARTYLGRVTDFIGRLDVFPNRGTVRDDIRPGLRIIGFERRVNIAFIVEGNDVIILRILYAGQQFRENDDQ
jgi:plasmid stabilization system protein ParE